MVLFDCSFLLVIGFDYSCRGVLLFFFLQKSCNYDLKNCFYKTFSVYFFVVMSLLV